MYDVEKIRKEFAMFDGEKTMQGHKLVYLDNSATTFKPNSVLGAIQDYYSNYCANSHRGDYDLAHNVDVKFENARETVAKFINSSKEEVIFTAGTTASLNLIAYSYALKTLKKDDEILLNEAEHASNILPWYEVAKATGAVVKFIPLSKEGRLTIENIEKTITSKTKIISFAIVTNVLGYLAPAKEIIKLAHKNNIIVVCDGAQSVPHLKTDVKDLDCDFLAFSAHKMCGPTGLGVLYARLDLLKEMSVYQTGGGMNTRFDSNGNVSYSEPPFKYEAGTPNIEGVLALAKAIDFLNDIGLENIHKYELELREYAINKLKKLDNVIIYNENAESGIITFNIKNVFAQDAATYLNYKGICVRSGLHCAKALPHFLNTPATCRMSLYLYNTKEEIDALVEACKTGGDFLDAYFA